MSIKRIAIYSIFIFFLIAGIAALLAYYAAFKPNLKSDKPVYELFIRPDESEIDFGLKMDSIVCDTTSIIQLSKIMNFTRLKPGRYLFKPGMDNFSIINKLKRGVQDPVKVTINSVRDIYQLSAKLGNDLLLDSTDFVKLLTDSNTIKEFNYTQESILSLFIPNTYEMYWTISADRFFQRMIHEHEIFWSRESRSQKAVKKALSENAVYTIASIVEKETLLEYEKPIIARVYINRLNSGMKLQADPTVVFALGISGIQRVLLEHLKVESPYNTYIVEGLPPGPICMPSVSTIDSVLNAQEHEYLYFCAKPGYEGGHAFAKTLEGHSQNARVYRQWLNKQRIR